MVASGWILVSGGWVSNCHFGGWVGFDTAVSGGGGGGAREWLWVKEREKRERERRRERKIIIIKLKTWICAKI